MSSQISEPFELNCQFEPERQLSRGRNLIVRWVKPIVGVGGAANGLFIFATGRIIRLRNVAKIDYHPVVRHISLETGSSQTARDVLIYSSLK